MIDSTNLTPAPTAIHANAGSAVGKLTLAAALKQTTSVSRAWLAQRLQMGASDSSRHGRNDCDRCGPVPNSFRGQTGPTPIAVSL